MHYSFHNWLTHYHNLRSNVCTCMLYEMLNESSASNLSSDFYFKSEYWIFQTNNRRLRREGVHDVGRDWTGHRQDRRPRHWSGQLGVSGQLSCFDSKLIKCEAFLLTSCTTKIHHGYIDDGPRWWAQTGDGAKCLGMEFIKKAKHTESWMLRKLVSLLSVGN